MTQYDSISAVKKMKQQTDKPAQEWREIGSKVGTRNLHNISQYYNIKHMFATPSKKSWTTRDKKIGVQ